MGQMLSKLAAKVGIVGQPVSIVIGDRLAIGHALDRSYARLERLEAKLVRAKERKQPLGEVKFSIKRYQKQIKMFETILNIEDESIE